MSYDIENLLNLKRDEFLNELFLSVNFESWEKDIIRNSIGDYELDDDNCIKIYSKDGNLMVDIGIDNEGNLELLSTFFDELEEM